MTLDWWNQQHFHPLRVCVWCAFSKRCTVSWAYFNDDLLMREYQAPNTCSILSTFICSTSLSTFGSFLIPEIDYTISAQNDTWMFRVMDNDTKSFWQTPTSAKIAKKRRDATIENWNLCPRDVRRWDGQLKLIFIRVAVSSIWFGLQKQFFFHSPIWRRWR